MSWDLRCGRWQDTLADVECDALIVDAPYSARTHGGHDSAPTVGGNRSGAFVRKSDGGTYHRRAIEYDGWTPEDVRAFVESWAPRTRGWIVTITDHMLAPVWDAALSNAGRYVFAPLPWVAHGSRVRLTGDGPSSWTCWIVVARPRDGAFRRWGTLPGAYVMTGENFATRGTNIVAGAKPPNLMRALVQDYTRPGDLVCDPCAGGGTTLLAAVQCGRRAIGSEMDPETHAQAVARLTRDARQIDLYAASEAAKAEQAALL